MNTNINLELKTKIINTFLLLLYPLFFLFLSLPNVLFSNPVDTYSGEYSVVFLTLHYYLNGSLKNVNVSSIEDIKLEDFSYNWLMEQIINLSNHELKYDDWTRVGFMIISKQPFSTILWQVFPIGQVTSISATGCEDDHCETVVKTIGTADYVTVIWSCFNYDFQKFKGEPDLTKCKIVYITHNYPFIYGSGAATKSNIHFRNIIELNYGSYSETLNTKKAYSYSFIDFIQKVASKEPLLQFNLNNLYKYYNNFLDFDKITQEI
ncbi:MAG: hypothetical protein ABGW69_01235 [Nanoarchaeota archaeon]